MTRQRLYQIRHRRLGLCIRCPRPAWRDGSSYCRPHSERLRRKQGSSRRLQRWSVEWCRRFYTLWMTGVAATEIAQSLKVKPDTVYAYRSLLGFPKRSPRRSGQKAYSSRSRVERGERRIPHAAA